LGVMLIRVGVIPVFLVFNIIARVKLDQRISWHIFVKLT
jgi:hypothetical protein